MHPKLIIYRDSLKPSRRDDHRVFDLLLKRGYLTTRMITHELEIRSPNQHCMVLDEANLVRKETHHNEYTGKRFIKYLLKDCYKEKIYERETAI